VQLNSFTQKATKLNVILTVIISIFAIYGGAASIGLNVPRWAWISELKAAELSISENKFRAEQLHLSLLRSDLRDTLSRIAELEAKQIVVPTALRVQLDEIQQDVIAQKKFLRDLKAKNDR